MCENKKVGLLFALPFILGVLLFKLGPFVASSALIFTEYEIISDPVWIGTENYEQMFLKDELFRQSMVVPTLFVLWTVPMRSAFALFIAHALNFRLIGINFFRSAYYLPSILGGSVAVAILRRFIFQQNGLVNMILGVFGVEPIAWPANTNFARWTIILLNVWQFGSAMVIFPAALQGVPRSPYEAAEIDGAGKWQQFFKITIPLITPVIFLNMIMQTVNAFQEFNGPYMVTEGGSSHSTYLMSLYIYDQSFKYFNLGYGSALAWVLFALVVALSGVAFWSSKYRVFYSGEKEKAR